jgi:hypothetical protein
VTSSRRAAESQRRHKPHTSSDAPKNTPTYPIPRRRALYETSTSQ